MENPPVRSEEFSRSLYNVCLSVFPSVLVVNIDTGSLCNSCSNQLYY